jgi:hypothetical protein
VSTEISKSARVWLDSVLMWLGLPDPMRQDCLASGSAMLGGVNITFLQPPVDDKGYVVARAVVDEVPPLGQCEPFYQLVLEVQGMMCGPHTPVLGLDWPARKLLVSCSLEMSSVSAEDAAAILRMMQQMAIQWRDAIAQTSAALPRNAAPVAVAYR